MPVLLGKGNETIIIAVRQISLLNCAGRQKLEDLPGCAVLMRSVASIIVTKVIDGKKNTKHININNFKMIFHVIHGHFETL